CVGCDCSGETGFSDAKVIACAGQVISPGLINAHDHMTYSEGWPIDHGTTRYQHRHDWRGTLSTPQNPDGTGATSAGNRWVEVRQLLAGTTSMVGSGNATGLVRNLDRMESDETGALALKQVKFETFPLDDGNETFHADCAWNYKYTDQEAAAFSAFLPHVAEGINNYAAEEFRCESTSMAGARDYTERNAAHIHGIGLQAADYWNMARDHATLIWSPRSNIDLYGNTAQVALLDRVGGTVALGTDWTYSGSANILRELACADQWNRDRLDGYFTDEQLWRMVTVNAAHATHTDGRLGVLASGAVADVSVFAAAPGEYHHAVVTAEDRDVLLVLKAGAPLYGEAAVISALGTSGCSPIDVCDSDRSICLGDWGTYANLAGAVGGAYPALFCDPPEQEPTCVPSRPGEYSGALTATDADGDGIADASDDCPSVFNPVRPIDGGAQPDDDGDGTGDACDETPLAIDLDGDTVANLTDDCPFTANTNQADADGDDKGDACDACPDTPNPDGICMVSVPDVTIATVQNGGMSAGSTVTIQDAVVTGKNNYEIWVQDPSAGAAWSGVRVYKGSSPGVTIGDKVDVTGVITEYHGETELEDATITKTGTATPIAPVALTLAQAMDEQYEGVLVTITDADMGAATYDCSADDAGCADADLWTVVSGADTLIVYKKIYTPTDWATQIGKTGITGVMSWRYNQRRIMPRVFTDFTP
ncbi:MAG TPA: amidohydrolase family protein, partial [Kofleriaceae bacterium]|nr:amidohydrolase family protein [Kofleriaceae bacterium]